MNGRCGSACVGAKFVGTAACQSDVHDETPVGHAATIPQITVWPGERLKITGMVLLPPGPACGVERYTSEGLEVCGAPPSHEDGEHKFSLSVFRRL